MFSVSFSGRLKGNGPHRSDKRWVPTSSGVYVEVENVVLDDESGNRTVIFNVHVPSSFGNVSVMVPCIWNCNENTPVGDMYALPTWLQLVSKPHEFTLPETEHPWDLIPVLVAICMRTAATSMMHFGALTDHMALALLADGFDCKYSRYTQNTPMAIDALMIQMTKMGHATTTSLAYCGMIGGYLIANFFDTEVYAPNDIWQSAINNTYYRPSELMFHSNMSDVRCKVMEWMCGVEDELRAHSVHASTIVEHASRILEHTVHIFSHYDTIDISSSHTEAVCDDGYDDDSALLPVSTSAECNRLVTGVAGVAGVDEVAVVAEVAEVVEVVEVVEVAVVLD